jgi:hypothetical protein
MFTLPRPGGRVLALSALAAAVAIACTDRLPTLPLNAPADAVRASAPEPVRGCARLEVSLAGLNGAEVQVAVSADCGPLAPVVAGEAVFDRSAGALRIPVAVENRGTVSVRLPALLQGWPDSLRVLAPPGKVKNRHDDYLSFVSPDSVADGAYVWRAHGAEEAATLASGATSQPRWIEIAVHPGVRRLSVVLHAKAMRASAPVPALAPDSVPRWVYDPAFMVEGGSGWYLTNVVIVRFNKGTPQEVRQAAIDAIGGTVVGGRKGPYSDDGAYYVRVEGDGSLDTIFRFASEARRLPGVLGATAVRLVQPHELINHLLPNDGEHFKRTDFSPRIDAAHLGGRTRSPGDAKPGLLTCESP